MYFGSTRSILIIIFALVWSAESFPVEPGDAGSIAEASDGISATPLFVVLAVISILCAVLLVAKCAWCHDVLFSPKGDTSDTFPRRHSMEPPSDSSLSTPRVSSHQDLAVTIEPLPDIASAKTGKAYTKPMGYNQVVNKGPDVSDWFQPGGTVPDFPRAQLQYVKELGIGWFGSVVEGEASKMSPQKKKVKVVVQILREDLNSMERAYLLYTAKMFRDVSHENVLKIIGKCVDKEPYLLLYEHCPQGDFLKSYLIARRGISDDLVHSGAVLKMCCEVADGLVALHQKGFVHSDLACRNCLVSSSGVVKIGDYGTGFSVFKNEYLTVGDIAVPIRWISPDTVDVAASGQLFTKEVTHVDNVWTLGVVIWEILEFGKMPYMELNDDSVVSMVLKSRSAYLQPPVCPVPHRDRLYEAMRFCWLPAPTRLSSEQIAALLKHIFHYRPSIDSVDDFDAKWNSLVAAHNQRPALLSPSTNVEHSSYSPIPTDPATLRDNVQAAADAKTVSPTTTPTVAANGSFPINATEPANVMSPVVTPVSESVTNVIHEQAVSSPKTVPDANENDAERIEKRNFILTLSLADLASMKSGDLVEFYEYLSQDEIKDLERRHAAAVEEAEEAREKGKKRDQFLAMTLDEMEELKAEDLDDYMRCLDDLDRKETREKLAAAAAQRQMKQDLLEAQRKRILNWSEMEILDIDEGQLGELKMYLSNDEFETFKRNWERLQELKRRREEAERFLSMDDRELAQVNEEELTAEIVYLPDDQAQILKKKYEKLSRMKRLILNASDDELSNLTDGEFEHYLNILTVVEAEEVRNKRQDALERRRKISDMRDAIFALTPVELAKLESSDVESFSDALTDEEVGTLQQRRTAALEAREGLLSLDEEQLKSIDKQELENYYRFLTAEEISRIEETRNTPSAVVETSSPTTQGSELAEEAIRTAKEQLAQSDHGENGQSLSESRTPESKQRTLVSKRDSVQPLTITSLDVGTGEFSMPLATPELRDEHHQKRKAILATSDEDLRKIRQEEFEDYFQYLTAEEIFDLEERRKKSIAQQNSVEQFAQPASTTENGELAAKGQNNQPFGRSAWEARDYILHLSDNQLALMNSGDLKQFSTYFTSEEFNQIESRWADACEKRDFLQHSTDEDLAVMPTEQLEEFLSAMPEEERAQIRERVNAIQTRWLPATLRDEDAFREILKTVPSISLTSDTESGHQVPEPFGRHKVGPDAETPSSSVDVEDELAGIVITVEDKRNSGQKAAVVDHPIVKPLDGLFRSDASPSSPCEGLQIPEVRLEAATPVEDLSPSSDHGFVIPNCAPLNLEEDGLNDSVEKGDSDGEERARNTSTPLYETFADSMLKRVGPFGSMTEDKTAYITAPDKLWDESTTEVLSGSDDSQTQQEGSGPEVGDLVGDFVGSNVHSHSVNGEFGGDLFQMESKDDAGINGSESNANEQITKKSNVSLLD